MSEDWGAVRARLEQMVEDDPRWADIRAALERDKQQMAHIKTLREIGSKAQVEATALRQRVEELEARVECAHCGFVWTKGEEPRGHECSMNPLVVARDSLRGEVVALRQRVEELEAHWKDFMQWDESAIMFYYKKRAEAAEKRVEELEQTIKAVLDRALAAEKRAEAAEKRVEEQQRELERTTAELRKAVDELADTRVTEAELVKRVAELEEALAEQKDSTNIMASTAVGLGGRLQASEAKLARCVEALEPFIRRHCGLCVPVDEQGRMGEVTTESCVCDADQKQARAALAAAKGGE